MERMLNEITKEMDQDEYEKWQIACKILLILLHVLFLIGAMIGYNCASTYGRGYDFCYCTKVKYLLRCSFGGFGQGLLNSIGRFFSCFRVGMDAAVNAWKTCK